ncbi:MAG: flagellin [Phycisphaerales bacterium]
MTRINSNVNSLIAQRVLGQNNQALSQSLERLSTGLRINRAADGPAGLIASQNLRAEQAGLSNAISNAERADQVVNIAEGGLTEVSGLLTELQGLVTSSANTAGLSQEEKEANQLQIDSILQTIDRLAESTSFQGEKLLNGSFDYDTTSVAGTVDSFSVNRAKLAFGETRDVDVLVTQSAQQAALALSFGGAIDLTNATSAFVIELTGAKGSRELSFSSGTTLADFAAAINTFKEVTGVSALVSGAGHVRLDTVGLGSDEFVTVKVINDGGETGAIVSKDTTDVDAIGGAGSTTTAFTAAGNGITDEGQDIAGTINGVTLVGKGTTGRINTEFLDIEIDLTTAGAQALANIAALTITGGGADFQLAGDVNIAGKTSLGIGNVAARGLGLTDDSGTSRFLSDLGSGAALNIVDGDTTKAQEVLDSAIREVSALRGRLGSFQSNTVGATIRSLGVAFENSTAAESVIRDADFAVETAGLTRAQILSQSATQALTLANSQPQAALALLG